MVKPGGLMFVATINRTLKALGLAIIGAEYVLRWLPRGTHQFAKLVRPEELEKALAPTGLTVIDRTGVVYHPLADRWERVEGHGRQLHAAGRTPGAGDFGRAGIGCRRGLDEPTGHLGGGSRNAAFCILISVRPVCNRRDR